MSGLKIGLLFGGCSVEHEVSVVSARSVAGAMRETTFRCVPIGVTAAGRWLSPELSGRILAGDSERVDPGDAGDDGVKIVVDPGGGGLIRVDRDDRASAIEIDALFPLVHGWGGEDGRLQGALELAAVPCVGAGVLGSAVGMDKAQAKRLFESHELRVVPWADLMEIEYRADVERIETRIEVTLGFPLFVKPANGGSSIGISRVGDRSGLRPAIEKAFEHDRRVVVEQGLDAREIECAVLGNGEPKSAGLGEILPSNGWYDYVAKYQDDRSKLIIPASLDARTSQSIRDAAQTAFRALDLAGFARVDFLLERGTGDFYVNEVNTLPGFTPISMFPKLWEAEGMPFPRLIERLVELALERAAEETGRRARRGS